MDLREGMGSDVYLHFTIAAPPVFTEDTRELAADVDEVRYEAPVATVEPRLITLSISPYNELGRWSLEHAGIAYHEEPQGLAIHTIASRRAGGKGTTPVLVAGDEVVPESAEIAEWADRHALVERRLFPEGEVGEEVRALVRRFGGPEF